MEKKNLFLPIEFKNREFFSKLLLASFAIKYGFRVYIGSTDSIFRLIKTKKKREGIFFFKGGLELNILNELKKKCDHFVILDEELGTLIDDYAKIAKLRIWPGTEKFIERYYVIGNHGYETSINCFDEMKKSIRCTGWPRIDLWRKENEFLFKTKTDLIYKKYGNYILFSSDFGYNSEKTIQDRLNSFKKSEWQSIRDEFLIEEKTSYKVLSEFNQLLKILKQYDDVEGIPPIIVRPHPTDDFGVWQKFAKDLKNIKVIYDGEITPWINASSGLIHRGCTSTIQAHMRGLPLGHIISKNAKINELPYLISKHLYTADDLINFCKNAFYNKDNEQITLHEEFRKIIKIEKDKFSSEEIIKDLLELKTNKQSNYVTNYKDKIKDLYLNSKYIVKKYIKNFLRFEQNLAIASETIKIPGGINEKEVKDFLLRLSNQKFIAKKIFKNCIEIN